MTEKSRQFIDDLNAVFEKHNVTVTAGVGPGCYNTEVAVYVDSPKDEISLMLNKNFEIIKDYNEEDD
jgi:predicted DNA-binding protein with PD1-like motif